MESDQVTIGMTKGFYNLIKIYVMDTSRLPNVPAPRIRTTSDTTCNAWKKLQYFITYALCTLLPLY